MPAKKRKRTWSNTVSQQGFLALPNCLIMCTGSMNLTLEEFAVLTLLLSHQFGGNDIYPSKKRLANALGKSVPTIHRHLVRLEEKGFIKRQLQTGRTSIYDINPTIEKINNHSPCYNPIQKRIHPPFTYKQTPYLNMNPKENTRKRILKKSEKFKYLLDVKRSVLLDHEYEDNDNTTSTIPRLQYVRAPTVKSTSSYPYPLSADVLKRNFLI